VLLSRALQGGLMPQLEEKEKHDCTNEPIGKVMLWLAAFAVHGCEHVEMPKSMLLHASLGEKTEYNRLRCVVSFVEHDYASELIISAAELLSESVHHRQKWPIDHPL
jgi:hypothetical protein